MCEAAGPQAEVNAHPAAPRPSLAQDVLSSGPSPFPAGGWGRRGRQTKSEEEKDVKVGAEEERPCRLIWDGEGTKHLPWDTAGKRAHVP